jgi:hypothetical protein
VRAELVFGDLFVHMFITSPINPDTEIERYEVSDDTPSIDVINIQERFLCYEFEY